MNSEAIVDTTVDHSMTSGRSMAAFTGDRRHPIISMINKCIEEGRNHLHQCKLREYRENVCGTFKNLRFKIKASTLGEMSSLCIVGVFVEDKVHHTVKLLATFMDKGKKVVIERSALIMLYNEISREETGVKIMYFDGSVAFTVPGEEHKLIKYIVSYDKIIETLRNLKHGKPVCLNVCFQHLNKCRTLALWMPKRGILLIVRAYTGQESRFIVYSIAMQDSEPTIVISDYHLATKAFVGIREEEVLAEVRVDKNRTNIKKIIEGLNKARDRAYKWYNIDITPFMKILMLMTLQVLSNEKCYTLSIGDKNGD